MSPRTVPPVIPEGSWGSGPQPGITGNGLVLRPWRAGDEAFLVDAHTDPAIRHWHAFSMEGEAEASRFIARQARRWRQETGADWAVTGDGQMLGRIWLRLLDLPSGEGEVAYWVAPPARGRGVASRAVAMLIEWARERGMHRLALLHSTRNEVSCKVAVGAGFRLEGTAVRSVRHADGFHDMHQHARLLDRL